MCIDPIQCLLIVFLPLWLLSFAMHPIILCSNLQHRPIPGLWDVEPHEEPTAGAEKQK